METPTATPTEQEPAFRLHLPLVRSKAS
jgi:hypothetical protein